MVAASEATEEAMVDSAAMVAGSAALAVDPADPGAAVRSGELGAIDLRQHELNKLDEHQPTTPPPAVPAGSLSSVTSSAARAFASVCAARRDLAVPGQAEAPPVPGKLVLASASDAGTGWCFGCWYFDGLVC